MSVPSAATYPTPASTPPSPPWFVAVGLQVWQGVVARVLNAVAAAVFVVGLVSFVASVALQGNGTVPSEETLRMWTWAYSTDAGMVRWALPPLLVMAASLAVAVCATYVTVAPSLAMAKASGGGRARFGWRAGRVDREGRRTLRRSGVGVLLHRQARWPLLVVGLLGALTMAVVSAVAVRGGLASLGFTPGLLPWVVLPGSLICLLGFALLALDGRLVAVGPQLQVALVGQGVGADGYAVPLPAAVAQPPWGGTTTAAEARPTPVDLPPGQLALDLAPDTPTADLTERLERLAALHRAGELDDDEYHAAKAATLRSTEG